MADSLTGTPGHPRPANRLGKEKSPYLLQHQFNPVDWYPWGEEAFHRAAAENKPIFLSIGYSTCHWCHVMERESFENPALGNYLKEHFISIKVDREERPDIDKIYMTFVQMSTGSGGWPMSVFLTPDRKTFYGGTYFPPEPKHGRPSFLQLLQRIVDLWKTRRDDIARSADDITHRLQAMAEHGPDPGLVLGERDLHGAAETFKHEFDPTHGGFGGAPKFPRPSQPAFLLRYAARMGDADAKAMVLKTCDAMAAGGMHDQLGGGFARYSVDEKWLVPHFEKMLYDNAQLAQLYLDAFVASGDARHAEVARGIFSYVLRDMTHPEGGFYSAEDADSEGKEGKFYCWTHSELSGLLTPEEFNVVASRFGVTRTGNFVDHSDPHPLPGQNVLHIAASVKPEDQPLLETALAKMRTTQAKRIRPHRDDKVLASWNGMMLGAFARGFAILGDEEYLQAAEKNLNFLQTRLWDETRRTLHNRWRDESRDEVQLLDAYAHVLAGVTDLYETTLNPAHLTWAIEIAEGLILRFHDPKGGGFWQTVADAPHLLVRHKESYDGAEPSGNSTAALALLRLAHICDRKDWRDAAEGTLKLFASQMHQAPQAVPLLLQALLFWIEEPRRIVIVGDWCCGSTRSLLNGVHRVFQPQKVVLGNHGPVEAFARTLPGSDEYSMAYCCTGTACQPPTRDRAKVREFLTSK